MALSGKDVLRLVVDADSSGAIREFDKLGKQVKSTVGDVEKQATGLKGKLGSAFDGLAQKSPMVSSALQKMGISGQQAGAMIATAIPAAAVAAGAAVGAFAAKGVADFQRIALAAGKFGDATGLGVEQASRWLEVAGDIGISGDVVQSAFIKMEKAMGANKSAFADMVVTGKNGAVDLTATFLNVTTHLQNIEDPIKRASESSKLFGRGFAEVSRLIGMDADDLRKRLEGISEVKVITPEELAQARKFDESMKALGDSVQEAGMMIGQQLIPKLTQLSGFAKTGIEIAVKIAAVDVGGFRLGDIAKEAVTAINPMQRLQDVAAGLFDRFRGGAQSADDAGSAIGNAANATERGHGASLKAAEVSRLHAEALNDANTAAARFGGSADALAQNIGDEAGALRDANDALAEHTNATLAAFDSSFAIAKTTNDFAKALLEAETAAQDSTVSAGELQMKYDEQTQSAVAAAEAQVRLAEDTAKAENKSWDASDSQRVLIDSLKAMAAQATGPSRDALNGLIAKLEETGAQKPAPTVTLNDQATGRIASIRATLTAFGGMSVTAAAHVTADTSSADRALQSFLSRVRNSSGMVIIGGLTRASGGPIPGSPGQAVPVLAHGGEYVLSADVVDRIKKGGPSKGAQGPGSLSTVGGGGAGTVINLNGTFLGSRAEFGRIVDEALAESRRRGNRAA